MQELKWYLKDPIRLCQMIVGPRSQYEMNSSGNLQFSCSINEFGDEHWYELLDQFWDANIFQTPAFCEGKTPGGSVQRVIIRRGVETVAAALARVITIPGTDWGISHVRWGPIWQRKGQAPNPEIWRGAIRTLRKEYVQKRKALLRIVPNLSIDEPGLTPSMFDEDGFILERRKRPSLSMLVDLTPSLPDLRKGLAQKWRNCLNSSEKNRLEIVEGAGDDLFEMFLLPYKEMLIRKSIPEPGDIRTFRNIQRSLPEKYKMRVFLSSLDGEICAGAIASAIGKVGIYLFGGTGQIGMKTKASYMLQWRIIEWLKESKCTCYDLHGVNAIQTPGVYAFKKGLCGRNGREIEYIGPVVAYNSKMAYRFFRTADHTLEAYRKIAKRVQAKWQRITVA